MVVVRSPNKRHIGKRVEALYILRVALSLSQPASLEIRWRCPDPRWLIEFCGKLSRKSPSILMRINFYSIACSASRHHQSSLRERFKHFERKIEGRGMNRFGFKFILDTRSI